MAKPEAFGKTTPYATCPICHDIMLTEEYDGHMKNSHNQEQRDRFGIKIEEKPGPKGHFYGDVWTNFGRYGKNEQQPYQFTQAEFDAITRDAWEQNCEECRGIIENTEMNGSEYAIHPTPEQKTHMTDLFGYEAEPTPKSTGYLDPEDPAWQKSVEHIQKRYKGAPVGTFGPQSAMPRGEPTKNEWQIASYLDSIGVEYVHKMKLGELDPDTEKPKIEYDFYIPKLLIGIETSPSWHEGGPSEIQRVAENDKFKRQFAKENGITLFVYDPDEKFGGAEFINQVLAPELRTQGVDAPDVPTGEIPTPSEKNEDFVTACPECGSSSIEPLTQYKDQCSDCGADWLIPKSQWAHWPKHEEDLSTEGRTYGDPRFNEWDTPFIYREEETKGVGYDWDYNTKYREKPILDEQDKPIGDSWKVKTKHNICRNCGKETELYDICNYHHHVDNFMGEHEKFQMIVDSGGLEWDKLPPELQEFETKYGTAFPCPMDIDPEDMGTFKKEEQTDVPEGVVPPEGYARQTTEEAAMGVLDHLIKGGVESFESWDEVIDHLQFLVDTGYIANFQPPNISEKEFEVWKPLIQGLMRQQTRWPNLKEERPKTSICENCGESMTYCSDCDLHHHDSHWIEDHKAMKGRAHFTEEQSGINQNIPTGAYTRLEPLTQDQSQNVPRFPERGKVNTIEQQSGGEEMAAENHLFQEEDEGRWDRPAPDTPEDEAMRKTYGELADETGDNVLQLVQDGTITPEAGDVLMEYQTKAKEAVMTSHFVEAHELLEKMAAYLLSAIPGLSD